MTTDHAKQAAAQAAASLVQSGMVIGLGTGSTAKFVVDALAHRMSEGLRFLGIPTSQTTAEQAHSLGIPLTTLADHPKINLTIDGADEIHLPTLNLIKGRGGALLREKIVAASSSRLVIIADESKLVEQLGSKMPVPVEVDAFGWQSTAIRLEHLGCRAVLRENFITDGGHRILDCAFGVISDAQSLAQRLDSITGVVEHGLFLGMATEVFVGTPSGVRRFPSAPPRFSPHA